LSTFPLHLIKGKNLPLTFVQAQNKEMVLKSEYQAIVYKSSIHFAKATQELHKIHQT
jgi:hypothetical protein